MYFNWNPKNNSQSLKTTFFNLSGIPCQAKKENLMEIHQSSSFLIISNETTINTFLAFQFGCMKPVLNIYTNDKQRLNDCELHNVNDYKG